MSSTNEKKRVILKKKNPVNADTQEKFPVNIPESQGDMADQAELQIEADLQEEINQARHGAKPKNKFAK